MTNKKSANTVEPHCQMTKKDHAS